MAQLKMVIGDVIVPNFTCDFFHFFFDEKPPMELPISIFRHQYWVFLEFQTTSS
jgi:hypothetical protein